MCLRLITIGYFARDVRLARASVLDVHCEIDGVFDRVLARRTSDEPHAHSGIVV